MNIIVTGSSGFIGTHLTRALRERGHDVLGIDRGTAPATADILFERCDILDAETLRAIFEHFHPAVVFHLAARIDLDEKDDLSAYAANIEGAQNVVDAIRSARSVRRSVFVSSKTVCYDGYTPKHDTDFAPFELYGQSKVMTERIVRENDGGGGTWCIVRPPTVWGPGVSPHYQRFFRMINRGTYFQVGRKRLRKSYAYIGNVIYQLLRLMEAPDEQVHRKVFYVGEYEPQYLRDWVEMFRREFDARPVRTIPEPVARLAARVGDMINLLGFRSFPFNSFRLRNVLTEYQLDLTNTREVCGPLPYTIEDGVRETVEWMRKHKLV